MFLEGDHPAFWEELREARAPRLVISSFVHLSQWDDKYKNLMYTITVILKYVKII